MKVLCTGLMVTGLIVITGCNMSTTGGTPGGGKFRLEGPTLPTTVKHGETKTVDITASEAKDFKEDVTLTAKVDKSAEGIKAELKPTTIKASDPKKAELSITVGDKTPSGDYVITITGKPTKGDPTNLDVKVKVPEKK